MGWYLSFSSVYSLHAELYGSFCIIDYMAPLIEKELGFNAAEMG